MYKGFEFFIRYLKSPKDWQGNYYDYKYENLGRIKIRAKILDSTDSIFTPSSYNIEVQEILGSETIIKKVKMKDIIEVNSFRGRFCEHAIKGEEVLIEGKIESVVYKNSEKYFRILLSDQVHDKMISI